ncbi:hypothetical protein AKO1_000115, partial [Acrasis kona]
MLSSHLALSLNEARFEQVLQSEKQLKVVATELGIVKKRLEEFIDVLCHELRNPLNAIFGNKDIIADHLNAIKQVMDTFHAKKNDPVELTKMITFMNNQIEECRDSVAAMTISSDHLKDIVDTVLTVSMLEDESNRLQIVKFNPHQVIQMIAIMFKATVAEKKLTLLTKTDQSSVQHFNVMGDLYRFKEVIINLVSNAIKFTEEGTITISIGIESIKDDQVTLLIQVQDTGIGIKKDEISKLFQKFSQANSQTFEKYGGSGLGLKISKEIVQLMGGTPLQIKSVYGKGSTFYFSVPFKMCTPTDDGNNGGGQLPSPRGVTLLSNPVRTSKIAMSKHQLFDSFEKNEKT